MVVSEDWWPPDVAPATSAAEACRSSIARRYTGAVNADLLAQALRLSPDDRLRLIEALRGTLSEVDIPVTREERALLDARLADT